MSDGGRGNRASADAPGREGAGRNDGGARRREKHQPLGRKSFLMVAGHLTTFVMSYVALYFVAHNMGTVVLGIIGYALSFVTLFSFLIDLGFGVAHVKKVSEGRDLADCIGTYGYMRRALFVLFLIVVAGAVFFDSLVMGTEYSRDMYLVVALILGSVGLHQYAGIYTHTYAGLRETAKMELSKLSGSISQSAGRIIVAVAGLGLVMLAGAYLLGGVVMLFASMLFFAGKPRGRYDPHLAREYLKYAIPAAFPIILMTITVNMDKLMVGWFWDYREVGYYVGAERVAFFFIPLSVGVRTLLMPSFSDRFARGEDISARRLLRRAEKYLSLFGIPITIAFLLFASPVILLVLGREFRPAVLTFTILAVVAYFMTMTRMYNTVLMGYDRPDLSARVWVVMSVLNVLLNLVFIPKTLWGAHMLGLGAAGSAMSTLLILLTAHGIYLVLIGRFLGSWSMRTVGMQAGAGIIAAVPIHLLFRADIIPRWIHITAGGLHIPIPLWMSLALGYLLVYAGILFLLGEFTRRDIRYLRSMVSPSGMKDYIGSELSGKNSGKGSGK